MGKHHAALKTVLKGAGISTIGLLISKLLGLVYRVFVGRALGPSEYGLLWLGVAALGITKTFVAVGLPAGVKRYVAYYTDKEHIKGVILSALEIVLPLGLLVMVGGIFFADAIAVYIFEKPELGIVLMLMLPAAIFRVSTQIFTSVTTGLKKIRYEIYVGHITMNVVKVLATAALIYLGFGLAGAAVSWVMGIVASFLLSYYFVQKVFPAIRQKTKAVRHRRELFSYSWPLFLNGILGVVMGWTDTVVLGIFNVSAAVGLYNAAYPIAQTLAIIPVTSLFMPVVTELYSEEEYTAMWNTFHTVMKWLFLLLVPGVFLLSLFSEEVLLLLFGREYTSGAIALIILSLGFFFVSLQKPTVKLLEAVGKTKLILVFSSIGSISNLLLNIVLIPLYGQIGAALATTGSFFLTAAAALFSVFYFFGEWPFPTSALRILVAGGVSIGLVYAVSKAAFDIVPVWVLVPAFLVFAVSYAATILLIGVVDSDDIAMLKLAEEKTGVRIGWLRRLVKRFIRTAD